jgi:hypothetical protein
MAEFATIPERVLLVGEDDRMNPPSTRLNGEVRPGLDGHPLNGDAFQKIDRFDFSSSFGGIPIDAVNALREPCGNCLVVILPEAGLVRRMAAVAFLSFDVIRAGGKDRPTLVQPLSVVASATMEALAVGAGSDSIGVGHHGKANVHMTEAAGEFRTMKPMVKDNWSRACSGCRVAQDYFAVVGMPLWGRLGEINLARP